MEKIFDVFQELDNNYITYNNSKIHIIIDNNDEIWFNARQIAKILEYKDIKNAIKVHVDSNDVIQLKYINYKKNNDDIKPHPNSKYFNEAGLYSLIISSRMPIAKKFKYWITHEILPSIRKYGYYKLKKETDIEINNLLHKINYLVDKNKQIKNDLRKKTYPNGGIIYAIDYSTEYENIYRIGMSQNMNLRKKIYDTHTLHDRKVVFIKETKCPIRLECCLKAMLYDFRFGNKKDFYVCSLKDIKLSVNKCIRNLNCIKQNGGSKYNLFFDKQITSLNKKYKKLIKKSFNLRFLYY